MILPCRSLTAGFLGVLLVAGAAAHPAHAIIGGTPVGAGDSIARSTVLIVNADQNGCTGTLIGRRTVLTAAHCVRNTRAAVVAFVRQGSIVALTPVLVAAIHPGVASRSGSAPIDVAVLTLRDLAPEGYSTARIGGREPAVGSSLTIAGFGRQQLTSMRSAGQLRRVNLPLIQRSPSGYKALGVQRLLATGRAPSACQGDSGGPALQGGAVVGVVSLVSGPTESRGCGSLTVAMPVVSIAPWIRNAAAIGERQAPRNPRTAVLPPPRSPERQGMPGWARPDSGSPN